MKPVLLFVLTFLNFLMSDAQKSTNYFVTYIYEQNSFSSFLPDSVKNQKVDVKVKYGKDSTTKIETIESTLDNLLTSFNFETSVFIIANSDSSKMFFSNGEGSNKNIRAIVSTPDTIIYRKGAWRKTSDGLSEPLTPVSVPVIETKETKDILGYECIKFISSDDIKGEETIFWACKALPNTLLPYTGLKSFKYGILEIVNLKNKCYIKATRIRKL